MIRVGFVLVFLDHSWIGGLNYYKSLLSAIHELPERQVDPVLFVGKKTPPELLQDFPSFERVPLALLDRWSPQWVLRKSLHRCTGKDRLLESELLRHGVTVLSHAAPLGKGATVKSMGWIQDFQHRRLPEFFSDRECAQRDGQFGEICRNSNVILVSSHAARGDLATFMPECEVKSRVLQFVPDMSGMGHAAPIDAVRQKYRIEGPYFHLPNQFWRHKNHAVVIAALGLLERRGHKITVICTGNTSDHRHPEYFSGLMQTVERSGLAERFRVLGVVPYADLMAIMMNSVALINPSLFEGWSTTVEESKVLGKPMLLSSIDVHVEQAPTQGSYFDPHDANALAELMLQAASSGMHDAPPTTEELLAARRGFAHRYQQIVLEAAAGPLSCENKDLLIVQPWFTAYGHPAQSTLNTATVLGRNARVSYLISRERANKAFTDAGQKLCAYGQVDSFPVPSPSIRIGTLLSLIALLRLCTGGRCERILYLDAHLVLLSYFWRWIAWLLKPERLSVIYLAGPEKIAGHKVARASVSSFLSRTETVLFLRTEELAKDWKVAFPEIPEAKIEVLPSLELPEPLVLSRPARSSRLQFGLLGQLRPGKGVEWLVPLFAEHLGAGALTVAGAFIDHRHEQALSVLRSHPGFSNRFLGEDELVELAARQHYLLMLYDDWDARMEAATLYLAARVGRPVIVRGEGWCGRMVRTYNCGVICRAGEETVEFFLSLPKPGEHAYDALLAGVEAFHSAHSGETWKQAFLDKVTGK